MTKSRGNRDRFGALQRNDCEMITTFGPDSRGIKVRCYCMAVYGAKRYRSLRYDALGTVETLAEAVALWTLHKQHRDHSVQDITGLT